MSKIAIYAGSFNPWHKGHQYVYDEGRKIFDDVLIVKAINPIKITLKQFQSDNIPKHVHLPQGQALGVYAAEREIEFFIRGIRNTSDYDYEFKMAVLNKEKFGIQTVFIPCDPKLSHINSSMLRELNSLGIDVREYLI